MSGSLKPDGKPRAIVVHLSIGSRFVQHEDLMKFIGELPIAIALLVVATWGLIAMSEPHVRLHPAEYVVNLSLAE